MPENKFNVNFIFFVSSAAIIGASLLIGLVITVKANIVISKQIVESEEEARPAELDIIILQDANCTDCSDVELFIEVIEKQNVQINSNKILEISSQEAKELIDRFSIDKVPTFIVSGEIEKDENLKKIWSQIGDIQDGSFILRQVMPPYISVSTGEVKGRAKLIMLNDIDCEECYDVSVHEKIMAQFNFPTINDEIVDIDSSFGKELVNKYNIQLVPTIILIGDVEEYPELSSIWNQVGTIEDDGAYIFRDGVKQMGVYKNLISGQVVKPGSSN